MGHEDDLAPPGFASRGNHLSQTIAGKEGAVAVETLDLGQAARSLAPIFHAAFSGRATFRFEGEEEVLPIRANPILVEQAVMKLELSEAPMLMFRNASHFGLNVVHRRVDGSIGWIDPRGVRHLNS